MILAVGFCNLQITQIWGNTNCFMACIIRGREITLRGFTLGLHSNSEGVLRVTWRSLTSAWKQWSNKFSNIIKGNNSGVRIRRCPVIEHLFRLILLLRCVPTITSSHVGCLVPTRSRSHRGRRERVRAMILGPLRLQNGKANWKRRSRFFVPVENI